MSAQIVVSIPYFNINNLSVSIPQIISCDKILAVTVVTIPHENNGKAIVSLTDKNELHWNVSAVCGVYSLF